MNLSRLAITLAIASQFMLNVCHAQLGAAPMPQIQPKKSAGPSLEETSQWITQKFETLDQRVNWESKYRAIFDGCNASIVSESTTDSQFIKGRRLISYNLYYFKLQEVESTKIQATLNGPNFFIDLWGSGDRDTIREAKIHGLALTSKLDNDLITKQLEILRASKGEVYNQPITVNGLTHWVDRMESHIMSITFPDMEITERMANAFKHAILLCQQKTAQEKAAQPPKPKELF